MKLHARHIVLLWFGLGLCATALAAETPFVSSPDEVHGTLQTGVKRQASQIYPVFLYEVNGEQIARRQTTLWMKPGKYTLTFKLTSDSQTEAPSPGFSTGQALENRVDTSMSPGLARRDINPDMDNRLTLEVKAGKTYYIGAKILRSNKGWKPVVWKTKDTGGDNGKK